jgi:NAD+ synthase
VSAELPANTALVRRILVSFLRDEVRKVGVERVVLGLSGGVDSSLAAFLAAEALGAANVLGIRMPYRTSSRDSLDDARSVVDALGIPSLRSTPTSRTTSTQTAGAVATRWRASA